MSLICRVIIGYFDAESACVQRTLIPTRPLNEEQVDRLQEVCDHLFGRTLRLSEHLTEDGLLCVVDGRIQRDTYKVAAAAHGVFGMSVVDHAHRCVIFPAADYPLPEREDLLRSYQLLRLDMDEQARRQKAEDFLRRMREEREFQRGVRERVRSFAAGNGGIGGEGRRETGSNTLPRR